MKDKKKLIIITIITMVVMIATIGVTFAMFMYSETGETSKLVLGDIWMKYTEKEGISLQNAMPGDPYSDYFEFTITGTNTYEKKDIWYDVILSNGNVPDGKLEENRIDSKYLKFRLVEVNGEEETVIFTDRNYDDLNNRRVYVSTIPKNTTGEYNKTYRMYMTLSENLAIGNTEDSVMTMEDFENVFASVKVSVTGDFNKKIIETDASCFTTEVSYVHNRNLTSEQVNICVTLHRNNLGWTDSNGSVESYCQGTGTFLGNTFQEKLDAGKVRDDMLVSLEENGIIIKELKITDYDMECGSDVVIPNTINGLSVVEISGSGYNSTTGQNEGSFSNKQLTSVVIPNSVTTIGTEAFYGNSIGSLEVPNSVTTIGDSAFSYNDLTSINIPNSVTYIGAYVFKNNQLTSIVIPNSVTTIETSAFQNNKISSLTFEENSSLTSIGEKAFYGENNVIEKVTIPESVITIYCNSFNDNVIINKNDDLVCIQGK